MRRALSFRWRASYRIPTPSSSDACTHPVSAWSPVVPRRHQSNRSHCRRWAPITSSTASMNFLQICCPGGHRTTTAARAAIAKLLQLRKPSHNYCCSGCHRTTAAPAADAPASSSSSFSESTSKFAGLFSVTIFEVGNSYRGVQPPR